MPSRGCFLDLPRFSYERLVLSHGAVCSRLNLRMVPKLLRLGSWCEKPMKDHDNAVRGAFPILRGLLIGSPFSFLSGPNKCLASVIGFDCGGIS